MYFPTCILDLDCDYDFLKNDEILGCFFLLFFPLDLAGSLVDFLVLGHTNFFAEVVAFVSCAFSTGGL